MTDTNTAPEGTVTDWTASLGPATEGLLYPSETDAPVVPFVWEAPGGQTQLSTVAVARLSGHPVDSQVEEIRFSQFFDRVTRVRDWDNEVGRERVRRFTELEGILEHNLRGIRVFRIGTIAIDVYVVGVDTQDRLAGVSTKVVET
jgi:hypothetical protein